MIYNLDLIPRAADAGVDAVIRSLSYETIEDMPEFLARLNSQITPLRVTLGPLLQYLADRQFVGALVDVAFDGELPPPIERPAAPTGVGTDGSAVWYTEPAPDEATVARWYVMGSLRVCKTGQFANSVSMAELEAGMTGEPIQIVPGNKVQVCIEAGGVVGWWRRITV